MAPALYPAAAVEATSVTTVQSIRTISVSVAAAQQTIAMQQPEAKPMLAASDSLACVSGGSATCPYHEYVACICKRATNINRPCLFQPCWWLAGTQAATAQWQRRLMALAVLLPTCHDVKQHACKHAPTLIKVPVLTLCMQVCNQPQQAMSLAAMLVACWHAQSSRTACDGHLTATSLANATASLPYTLQFLCQQQGWRGNAASIAHKMAEVIAADFQTQHEQDAGVVRPVLCACILGLRELLPNDSWLQALQLV